MTSATTRPKSYAAWQDIAAASGFAHFVGSIMDEAGFDRTGFRTGRKLASDDLQLLLLALIADKPSHGYDLIKLLEERSDGYYVPSPGMVYPALTYLEEAGYADRGAGRHQEALSHQRKRGAATSRQNRAARRGHAVAARTHRQPHGRRAPRLHGPRRRRRR